MSNKTTAGRHTYAVAIMLPQAIDDRMLRWSLDAPGATWDTSGGHITVTAFHTVAEPEEVSAELAEVCRAVRPFRAHFAGAEASPYWGRAGLSIVMLVEAEEAAELNRVHSLRRALNQALAQRLEAFQVREEAGDYVPHVTLTTGLPESESGALVVAARSLDIDFTVEEVALWHESFPDGPAEPYWYLVRNAALAG